jgi:hypothetical protein
LITREDCEFGWRLLHNIGSIPTAGRLGPRRIEDGWLTRVLLSQRNRSCWRKV